MAFQKPGTQNNNSQSSLFLQNLKVNNFPVKLIESYNDLLASSKEIAKEKLIAFDTEFDRMREKYGFNLEMIQILAKDTIYLIRVCHLRDITPLKIIFEDTSITKIIYAGSEDVQLLKLFNIQPQNIVDLRIVSRLCDYPSNSFKQLLSEVCGIEIEKSKQKSNWSNPSLDPEQILYAARDVAYSIDLYQSILKNKRLEKVGDFIQEETVKMMSAESKEYTISLNSRQKKLPPLNRAILLELLHYRDRLAQKANKPPYRIFSEDLLEEIVKNRMEFSSITDYPECPKFYRYKEGLRNSRNKEIREILQREYEISRESETITKELVKKNTSPILEETLSLYLNHLNEEFGNHAAQYIYDGILGYVNGKNSNYANYRIGLWMNFLETREIPIKEIMPHL